MKQRLWGATILVALAVIFVPMLFDEKGEETGSVTATNVPPLPPEVQEREIELPAMPDEDKSTDAAAEPGKSRERPSYRIIPLDDAPAPEAAGNAAQPPEREGGVDQMPAEFGADEGGAPDELPTPDSPLAKTPRAPARLPEAMPIRDEDRARSAVVPRSPTAKETKPPPAVKSVPATAEPAKPAVRSKVPEKKAPPIKPKRENAATASKPSAARPPKPARPAADASRSATDDRLSPKTPARAETGRSTDAEAAKPAPVRKPPEPAAGAKPDGGGVAAKPKPPSTELAKAVTPRSKPPDARPEAAPKQKTEAVASAAAPAPAGSAKSPATTPPKAAPAPKVAAPAAAKPKSSGITGPWVIRAGSYTSEASAKALVEKLRKQKFAAQMQKITGGNGVIYRVQVGPEAEKSRAEQTLKRLESAAGVRGTLVSGR